MGLEFGFVEVLVSTVVFAMDELVDALLVLVLVVDAGMSMAIADSDFVTVVCAFVGVMSPAPVCVVEGLCALSVTVWSLVMGPLSMAMSDDLNVTAVGTMSLS